VGISRRSGGVRLLCQFLGQQVAERLCGLRGQAAAQHPGGLLSRNGEAAAGLGSGLVVDFDAIEAGIGRDRLAGPQTP